MATSISKARSTSSLSARMAPRSRFLHGTPVRTATRRCGLRTSGAAWRDRLSLPTAQRQAGGRGRAMARLLLREAESVVARTAPAVPSAPRPATPCATTNGAACDWGSPPGSRTTAGRGRSSRPSPRLGDRLTVGERGDDDEVPFDAVGAGVGGGRRRAIGLEKRIFNRPCFRGRQIAHLGATSFRDAHRLAATSRRLGLLALDAQTPVVTQSAVRPTHPPALQIEVLISHVFVRR